MKEYAALQAGGEVPVSPVVRKLLFSNSKIDDNNKDFDTGPCAVEADEMPAI